MFSSDEILYDARIHPEQYSNTLGPAQVKQLHKSIQYVCGFAVEHLADSSKFPEEWLFKHRWGKGKKDSSTTLPNGSKFVYVTVGGRTSCVVPSVQKNTGRVAKDIEEIDEDGDHEEDREKAEDKDGKKASKSKSKKDDPDEAEAEAAPRTSKSRKRGAKKEVESTESEVVREEEAPEAESKPASKKRKSRNKAETNSSDAKPAKQKKVDPQTNGIKKENSGETIGKRRSTRMSGKGF